MTQPFRTATPSSQTRRARTAHAAHPAVARTFGLGLLAAAALALALVPVVTRAAEEPVDVPITRGKVELGSLKPTLAPPPPATAATPQAPATRPKPKTVADYAAEAKAKAAADTATKPDSHTTPHEEILADKAKPAAAKAPPPPSPATKPGAPARGTAPKAPDEGLDKVAVKLVEAMARATEKQQKRETPRPKATGSHASGDGHTTPTTSREYIAARAAALAGHGADGHDSTAAAGDGHGGAHWGYEGEGAPVNWAKLKPEFNTCAIGQRQSPIAIDDKLTLQGPAEPLGFDYNLSEGSVVNNGHTIQVDLSPTNSLTVRGGNYQLLQFHFHHPSEEQVNGKRYAMVAHLVHKNADGQLAVVAVLLTPGMANPVVDTVWKHMPLDTGDRVRLPTGALNLTELLPKDQRYYQFMGSLTTPPCTEGVLWMVLKTPVTVSPAQLRLFGQLFPNNARPVQNLNGRPVREAL